MSVRYLITYDIANPKRLAHVAKLMESYGVRVQYSVFECFLDPKSLKSLKRKLRGIMNVDEDGVKCFKLCTRCEQRITLIGEGEVPDLMQELLIL